MKTTLRILHVEQAPSDVEQARGTLEAEGFACDFRRVETAADFVSALEEGGFDLILADDSRPPFDGLSALAIAREISPDTPFVSFSEALDDESAKTLLNHGATDYVLKRCLFRLVPVIRRAVWEAEVRQQHRRAEATLQALHYINQAVASTLDLPEVLKILLEGIDAIVLPSTAGDIRLVNRITGKIELIACRNIDEEQWRATSETIQHPIHKNFAQYKNPLIVRNLQKEEKVALWEFYRRYGLVSYLGVPLTVRGEIIGVFSWFTKQEHEFTRDEIDFAKILAQQASVAIDNFRLHEQIGKLAQNLLSDQKQIQVLARGALNAQDDEDRRIARVLRDESEQLVAGACNTLNEIAKAAPAANEEQLEKAKKPLDEVKERLRSLSQELHPTILDDMGLVPSLELLAGQISKRKGINIALENEFNGRLSSFSELTIYRIVEEALNNVARHAQASKASVQLFQDKNLIHCSIWDNGIGFDAKEVTGRMGRQIAASGLGRISESAIMLGGRLKIESSPGAGTLLTAELPLRTQVAGEKRPASMSAGKISDRRQ